MQFNGDLYCFGKYSNCIYSTIFIISVGHINNAYTIPANPPAIIPKNKKNYFKILHSFNRKFLWL